MSSACIICHKKKIKCDLPVNDPCSNCRKTDHECRRHARKRKRYTNSVSPSRDATGPVRDAARQSYPQTRTPGASDAFVSRDQAERDPRRLMLNPTAKEGSYMGREEYLPGSVPGEEVTVANPGRRSSNADMSMLRQQHAFEMPPKTVRDILIDSFMQFCEPWTPIIDLAWLNEERSPSPLLLQAVFLAGSKVSPDSQAYASSEEFYRRAKLLFFFGSETNPIISIVAATLLQWYNPVGPENISTDTSGFWIRTAGAIAFQIGLHKEPPPETRNRMLRRRLWWSLVVRDNIISVGTGRPRTINLEDSDVSPPSLDDFPVKDGRARLFLAYVTIIQLLGGITECCLRKSLTPARRLEFENALFRWIKRLRSDLQLLTTSKAPRHHAPEARQLLVAYFAILIILYRSSSPISVPSAASLVASSFITGIFEEFLAKDEIRHLGPVFAFYALCAGLSQAPAYRYPSLRNTAEYELTIIKLSLQELSKQWASAPGSLYSLNKVIDEVLQQPTFDDQVPTVSPDVATFFEDFGPAFCRQWPLVTGRRDGNEEGGMTGDYHGLSSDARMDSIPALPDLRGLAAADHIGSAEPFNPLVDLFPANNDGLSPMLDMLAGDWEGSGFDWSGSWLLNDWAG